MRELIKITVDGSTEDGAIAEDAHVDVKFILGLLDHVLTDPDSFAECGIEVQDIGSGIPQ